MFITVSVVAKETENRCKKLMCFTVLNPTFACHCPFSAVAIWIDYHTHELNHHHPKYQHEKISFLLRISLSTLREILATCFKETVFENISTKQIWLQQILLPRLVKCLQTLLESTMQILSEFCSIDCLGWQELLTLPSPTRDPQVGVGMMFTFHYAMF